MAEIHKAFVHLLSGQQIASLPDQRKGEAWVFEPYLRMTNTDLQNDVDNILDDLCVAWMNSFEARKPGIEAQQHFIDCANVIMANLLRARCKHAVITVGIHRRKDRLDRERRYRPRYMTANRFIKAQDWLVEFGMMQITQKGYNFGSEGQTTRVALAEKAATQLDISELSLRDFKIEKPEETILLKDKNDQLSKYADTGQTTAMRNALERINAQIGSTDISTSRPLTSNQRKLEFAGTRASLYRVFNYGSFETGGRYYGGWWQHISKGARRLIQLDGVPVIEADYRGFNAAVLLAQAGLPIPDDPYSVIPGVSRCTTLREHGKTTLAAMLNSATGHTSEPRDFDTEKHGMAPEAFRSLVQDAFPMVRDMMGQKMGMKLQRQESDLAEQIMLYFVDQGLSILPMHDAFLVQEHLSDELVQVMQYTFNQQYGQIPPIKVITPIIH